MDQAEFQDWLSVADRLTAAQRTEAARALSTEANEERSIAAVERGVGESRVCPRCGEGGAVRKGKARGLWRYLCKSCGRTFNAVTGTPLQGLHKKERWPSFGESLAEGETVGNIRAALRHRAVDRLPVAAPVSGRLAAGSRDAARDRGGGRDLSPSKPERRRGGKAKTRGPSKDLAPVLFAADRSGARSSGRRWTRRRRRRSRTRSARPWRRTPFWSPTRRVAIRPARGRSACPTSL